MNHLKKKSFTKKLSGKLATSSSEAQYEKKTEFSGQKLHENIDLDLLLKEKLLKSKIID